MPIIVMRSTGASTPKITRSALLLILIFLSLAHVNAFSSQQSGYLSTAAKQEISPLINKLVAPEVEDFAHLKETLDSAMPLPRRLLTPYYNYTSDHHQVTFVPTSPSQNRLIVSEDTLQSMELDYNSAINKTLIKINTINPSDYHDQTSNSAGESGEWLWLGSSNHSLGCSLLKLNNSNQLALFRFKNQEVQKLVQWSVPSSTFSAYPLYLTEDCSFVSAGFNSWRVDEVTVSGSSPSYSVVMVDPPQILGGGVYQDSAVMGVNGDSLYSYAEGRVHKFSLSSNRNVTSVFLPYVNPFYVYNMWRDHYQMRTYQNRIMLISWKIKWNGGAMLQATNCAIHLIVDSGSSLEHVQVYQFEDLSGDQVIRNVYSSPELTRVYYQYRNLTNQTEYGLKYISPGAWSLQESAFTADGSVSEALNMTANDSHFLNTMGSAVRLGNSIYLGEDYAIFRNDSVGTYSPYGYSESYYAFGGPYGNIYRLASRSLHSNQVRTVQKLAVGVINSTNAYFYNYYPRNDSTGTDIHVFGAPSFTGTFSTVMPSRPDPVLILNYSIPSNRIIDSHQGIKNFEVFPDTANNLTNVRLTEFNTHTLRVSSLSMSIAGEWRYLVSAREDLSCVVLKSGKWNDSIAPLTFIRSNGSNLYRYFNINKTQFQVHEQSASTGNSWIETGSNCEKVLADRKLWQVDLNTPGIVNSINNTLLYGIRKWYPGISNDFEYQLQGRQYLSQFHPASNQYVKLLTICDGCNLYSGNIWRNGNRLIVWSRQYYNSTSEHHHFFVLTSNQGNVNVISKWTQTVYSNTSLTNMNHERMSWTFRPFVSPGLTKIFYHYQATNRQLRWRLIHADFAAERIHDINIPSTHPIVTTLQPINAAQRSLTNDVFQIDDDFIVLRNDLLGLQSGSGYQEQRFQIDGNSVRPLSPRTLALWEINRNHNITITRDFTGGLRYFLHYENFRHTAGQAIYKHDLDKLTPLNTPYSDDPYPSPYSNWNFSPNDDKVILSNNSQKSLTLSFNAWTNTTVLSLHELTRHRNGTANNQVSATAAIIGNATYVTGFERNFSCVVVHEQWSQSYAFLQRTSTGFTLAHNFTQASLGNGTYVSLNSSVFQSVDPACAAVRINNHIYKLVRNSSTSLSHLQSPSYQNGSLPLNDDLRYLALGGQLLKMWNNYLVYTRQAHCSTGYEIEQIFSHDDRVLVHCAHNSSYDVELLVLEERNGDIELLDRLSISGYLSFSIFVSPQITNFIYAFQSSTPPTLYHIDYDNGYLRQYHVRSTNFDYLVNNLVIKFQDRAIDIGERYLLLRNDTGSYGNGSRLEMGFEFRGQFLVQLGSRVVPITEMGENAAIEIDESNTTRLSSLNVYLIHRYTWKPAVISHTYNKYTGSVPEVEFPTPRSPYIMLNETDNQGQIILSKEGLVTLELKYDTLNNVTDFRRSHHNRSEPARVTNTSKYLNGNWELLIRSPNLGCALMMEENKESFAFLKRGTDGTDTWWHYNRYNLPSVLTMNLISNNVDSLMPQCDRLQQNCTHLMSEECNIIQFESTNAYLWMVVNSSSVQTYTRTSSWYMTGINYNGNSVVWLGRTSGMNDTLFVDTPQSGGTYTTQNQTLYPSDQCQIYRYNQRVVLDCRNNTSATYNRARMHIIKINATGYPSYLWGMWGYGNQLVSIVSPKLRNIQYAYSYNNSWGGSVYTYIKQIDWDNERFYYVRQMDWRKLYQTAYWSLDIYNSSATYYLGDDYLVIRNDSAGNSLTLSANVSSWVPQKNGYVQQAHQFIGNKLVFIKERKIDTANAKKTSFMRGIVEGGKLSVLDFEDRTRRSKGLDGWLTAMGGRRNPDLNPTVVSLFQDVFYQNYRVNGFYLWGFYHSENSIEFMRSGSDWRANKSRIEYIYHNRSDTTNYSKLYNEFDEDGWYIRLVSKPVPTCGLLYSWRAKSFLFVHFNTTSGTMTTVRNVTEGNMPNLTSGNTTYSWHWSSYYNKAWISSDCELVSFDGRLHFFSASGYANYITSTVGITQNIVNGFSYTNEKSFSPDFRLQVEGGNLKQYASGGGYYTDIDNGFAGSECQIHTHSDQMVIICWEQVAVNSAVHHRFYIYPFFKSSNGSYVRLTSTPTTFQYPHQALWRPQIRISPKLTKFHTITMPDLDPDNAQHRFFSIDFNSGVVSEVEIRQKIRLTETLRVWNNFTANSSYVGSSNYNNTTSSDLGKFLTLSEQFLIVRNDSNSSEAEKLFVEEVYRFERSNTLNLVKWRALQFRELFEVELTVIDDAYTSALSTLRLTRDQSDEYGILCYDVHYLVNVSTRAIQPNTTTTTQVIDGQNVTILTTETGAEIGPGIELGTTPQITVCPQPEITKPIEDILIEANETEDILTISYTASVTIFNLTARNHSDTNNYTNHQLYVIGTWNRQAGSRKSLSCQMIINANETQVKLLQFNSTSGTFVEYATLSTSTYNFTSADASEDCSFVKLSNGTFFRVNSGGLSMTHVYYPYYPQIQAFSADMTYIVSNYSIFKWKSSSVYSTSGEYVYLGYVGYYSHFRIESYDNRIITTASNATSTATGSYTISQQVKIWIENSDNLTSLKTYDYTSDGQSAPIVEPRYSSQLSNVFIKASNNGIVSVKLFTTYYSSLTVQEVTIENEVSLISMVSTVSLSRANIFVGESYVVCRNDTTSDVDAFEGSFQLVASTLFPLRRKPLDSTETGVHRLFVDEYYLTELVITIRREVVVEGIVTSFSTTVKNYGSLTSVYRTRDTSDTTKTAVEEVEEQMKPPAFTSSFYHASDLRWTYVYKNIRTKTTTLYFKKLGNTTTEAVVTHNFTLSSEFTVINDTEKCKLLQNSTEFHVFVYSATNGTLTHRANLTTVMRSHNSTRWQFTDDCGHMIMDAARTQISDNGTVQTSSYVPPDAITRSLRYQFISSDFFRADSTLSNYSLAHSISENYSSASNLRLKEYNGRVILFGSNSTAAYFYAFHDNGTHFNEVHSFIDSNFSGQPVLQVSPEHTKVAILGYKVFSANTSQLVSYSWHLNYTSYLSSNITFPVELITSLAHTQIILIDEWIYIRQLISNISSTLVEGVYLISSYTIPLLLEERFVSDYAKWNWNNTKIVVLTDSGNLKVITQLNTNTSESDWQRYEVSIEQAETDEGPLQNVNTAVSGNETATCPVGCADCSINGQCGQTCLSGFVYLTQSEICEPCGDNCLTCDQNDPEHCFTCGNGSYFANNQCPECDQVCQTCTGTANSCTDCEISQYFNSTSRTCVDCGDMCESCVNSTYCSVCDKGYVSVGGICRPCVGRCASCPADNRTQCSSCGEALYLYNNTCNSCPQFCRRCNERGCSRCLRGYKKKSPTQCVAKCDPNCRRCVDDQPTNCTRCFRQFHLNRTTDKCIFKNICTRFRNCTECPVGSGLVRVIGRCIPCPNITNCVQCSQSNSRKCAVCEDGYFARRRGSRRCFSCHSSCVTCVRRRVCTKCVDGFMIRKGRSQGRCVPCRSPCATCTDTRRNCLTCVSGYSLVGSRCRNTIQVKFNFTLAVSITVAVSSVDDIVESIRVKANLTINQTFTISIDTMVSGSTAVGGALQAQSTGSAGSAQVTAAGGSLSSGLGASGATVGGYAVIGSAITIDDGSSGGSSSSSEEGSEGSMIMIAIAVPAAVILVVIVIIIICVVKKRKAAQAMYDVNSSDKEDKDNVSNQSFAQVKQKATIEQIGDDPYHFSAENSPEKSQKEASKPMKRKKTRKAQNNSLFVYNNMPQASKGSLEEDYDFERDFGSPVAQ